MAGTAIGRLAVAVMAACAAIGIGLLLAVCSIAAATPKRFGLRRSDTPSSHRLIARLRLTSSRPNTATGAILDLIRPNGPGGKPKPEATGIFQLPKGTRISTTAVPACTKDDTTLQLEGESACPSSHVGEGLATLITGVGPPVDPLTIDDHWYYAPGQIVALYTYHGTTEPVLKVGRVRIRGATFIAPLDLPPGYPPGTKTVPKESDVTLDRYVGPRGSFITTPATCPASGRWVSRVTLIYDDHTTDSATDSMRCYGGQSKKRRRPR